MEELNHNMEREAVVVRIITAVTLIYLPGTFISVRVLSLLLNAANQNKDCLQHGHYQISESER